MRGTAAPVLRTGCGGEVGRAAGLPVARREVRGEGSGSGESGSGGEAVVVVLGGGIVDALGVGIVEVGIGEVGVAAATGDDGTVGGPS
jgi:hypothetical protein